MRKTIMSILERFFSSYREMVTDISGRFILTKLILLPFLTFVYLLTSLVILTMILIVLLIVIPVAAISKTKIVSLHTRG